MTEIVKQSMADIWASAGDIVAPDTGKIASGWAVEVVPRQYWNWMQNRTDVNLAYIFQHGIPEWDATVEYIINKSYVQYNDVVYKAILTGTNQNPSTATTYWKVAFATSTAALEALKALTPASDKLPYFNGTSTATTTTLTAFARTILDDTDAVTVRATIGAQASDATLDALAGLTTAANKLPYFTGIDTAAVTDLSAFGRSLIDDTDAATARTTLGLATGATTTVGTIATQNANAVAITGGTVSGVTISGITDLAIADGGTGASDALTARANLGLVKTTSATDTTAGSMLKVGDFNLPIDSNYSALPRPTTTDGATDLNTITTAGWWKSLIGAAPGSRNANHPDGQTAGAVGNGVVNYYHVFVAQYSTNIIQVAYPYVSGADTTKSTIKFRVLGGGVWSSWKSIWNSDNFDPTLKADVATSVQKDSNTGGASIPNGTTAQRPVAPGYGVLRANSTLNSMEWWNGTIWAPVGSGAGATGAGAGLSQDQIFNETDQIVTGDWTIGKGSMLSGATITIATPAVITFSGHGFTANQPVRFTTTGELPTGLSVNAQYFVLATGLTANTFQIAATAGGAAIATSGTQSGVHSVGKIKNALITKELKVSNGVSVTIPSGSSLVVVGAGGGSGSTDLYVNTFNAQNISGVKNFTSAPTLNGVDLTSIGINQTVQDLSGSRALSTTYTNTTGRAIALNVLMISSVANVLQCTVNGAIAYKGSQCVAGGASMLFAIIMPGATYSLAFLNAGTNSGLDWRELR